MESSEDDAGAATNASRRESAREKDVRGNEDRGSSADRSQELAEAATACETTSMSEEVFGGESVSSPSHDVNTSTEAILDMIDEIVEGPDALRRCSRSSEHTVGTTSDSTQETDTQDPIRSDVHNNSPEEPVSPSVLSDNTDIVLHESTNEQQIECPSHNSTLATDVPVAETTQESADDKQKECVPETSAVESSVQQNPSVNDCTSKNNVELVTEEVEKCSSNSSAELVSAVITESIKQDSSSEALPHVSESLPQENLSVEHGSHNVVRAELSQATSSVHGIDAAEPTCSEETRSSTAPEVSSECPLPDIPSSSVSVVQSVSDTSVIETCDRTIKCVASSDTHDSVTIENAESTSSDSSVSSVRTISVEPCTRSPLRRRLVRSTVCDRRPDSTVSSTVDSHIVNVHTTEQTPSDSSVTKDVSSSSDSVPSVHDNKQEIRNVSEISVCIAETSVSPPKKIKLIRQKVTPLATHKDNIPEKSVTEIDQCQSTSSVSSVYMLPEPGPSKCKSQSELKDTTSNLREDNISRELSTANITTTEASEDVHTCEQMPEQSHCTPRPSSLEEDNNVSENSDQKKVPPIKLNLNLSSSDITETKSDQLKEQNENVSDLCQDTSDTAKQVPKLTIKLGKQEETKSPIPKLTIRPIKPPADVDDLNKDSSESIPSITKLNIKPIPKPAEKINDIHRKSSSSEISESESSENDESNSTSDQASASDHGASDIVPKVTIKLGKPGTDSEGKFYTEQNKPKLAIKSLQHNDDEQESVSKLKVEKIPKLTIKTVTKGEGQPLSPRLTIKPLKPPENVNKDSTPEQADIQEIPKLKISADTCEEVKESSHVPKITIKPVVKTDEPTSKAFKKPNMICDSPEHIPVVTKLNIKPIIKPTENETSFDDKVPVVSKLNIKPVLKPDDDALAASPENKVTVVSKLNIKPVIKPIECGNNSSTESNIHLIPKLNIKPIIKSADFSEPSEVVEEHIPVVSKLYIKPIVKPAKSGITSDDTEGKVPVVSKLNIKPIVKPKDNDLEDSLEDVPKITKLNIKPLREPEVKSSVAKDCDDVCADPEENNMPVITKLNIKPIVKPVHEDTSKDSENQSSETGNSSDDNADHIPVVTKLNIKPILKPDDLDKQTKSSISSSEDSVPVVTKLNIKPLIKPDENKSPASPRKENLKVTKLNIKPVLKPEESDQPKTRIDEDSPTKNPPLVMKINMKAVTDGSSNDCLSNPDKKINNIESNDYMYNNVEENVPKLSKLNIKPIDLESTAHIEKNMVNCNPSSSFSHSKKSEIVTQNTLSNATEISEKLRSSKQENSGLPEIITPKLNCLLNKPIEELQSDKIPLIGSIEDKESVNPKDNKATPETDLIQAANRQQSSLQNCTLLKKLLETKKDGLDKRLQEPKINVNHSPSPSSKSEMSVSKDINKHNVEKLNSDSNLINDQDRVNDTGTQISQIPETKQGVHTEPKGSVMKPLEINVSDKITSQSSGQDSPRIILKINKTDHGASAKIITEEQKRSETPPPKDTPGNTQEIIIDKQIQKKNAVNSRKKLGADAPNDTTVGKRLRSSRIVESTEKTPVAKRNVGKRPSTTDVTPIETKEPELSVLESKRLKLGQLLSNKQLTITPVPSRNTSDSLPKSAVQGARGVNHSLLNNENCSKNGNSKLHNILSNLQAKQAKALALNDINCSEKKSLIPECDSNTSTGSSDVVEIIPVENSHHEVQQMIINENSESHNFTIIGEEASQDPLEVKTSKINSETIIESPSIPQPEPMTPQPKKRGRPRKLPVSEGAKPAPVQLPVPALEERPQRSLRLSRDRPAILVKTRGRGRGRGAKRGEPSQPTEEPVIETATKFFEQHKPSEEEIDPTSSRIKLPRMTEALDKMPSACTTPLSSRRRNSSTSSSKMFTDTPELKVVLSAMPNLEEVFAKSPETPSGRGRGSRGGRGRGRARGTPRGRGRGRGGGRGAMYMKETMGIYGRVCGPATTTVELFEEETCMMDDNATPAKPSHLIDEDSQSSVKSSTNDESSKMKKSKFADLFDSNKVWTAADVKEYKWPPPEKENVDHQVMMIQEQVAIFLGVKSFKRRYPELKRRPITGEEKEYVLSKGLVTEALCDLGITAVDASEVLDIMLSDYPHKYEEYRSHQHQKQLAEAAATAEPEESEPASVEAKTEVRMDRIEMKVEPKPVETKPEPSKLELEKIRKDMAAAAIASASEWNMRMNALRRGACVDLQTMTVQRRRPPPLRAPTHAVPPAGLYPHALLPGQYQHSYRVYTPQQLRYFPLNTALEAPPAPPSPAPSSSESDGEWSSSSSSEASALERIPAKRKKLTKTKRSSHTDPTVKEEKQEGDVDLCRVCKLRLEANRKYTHERFLVCANCNAKLHPSCLELSADTIRKCREYPWQCAECKTCCSCRQPADDDKMLFCDLCDRGFHIYCVGLDKVPSGRWHCVECAICKSCGARDPNGGQSGADGSTPSTPSGSVTVAGGGEWHHHTKRGPGGHKVYSHSLCTPCARAYRIGRYCPLCDRSFIGPKGTMQLVICKLCDRQHHQECVKQTVSQLNVLDYTCGECRRGGITSRAAAVRLAPRTIATLFMAKRRFNKYAHRQYMRSRVVEPPKPDSDDPAETSASCEPLPPPEDASDASDGPREAGDPLEGAEPAPDEAAAAVAALRMDFGD